MKELTRPRALWITGISVLSVGFARVALFWYELLSTVFKALRTGDLVIPPDFGIMFTAGKIVLLDRWSDVYDIRRFAGIHSALVGTPIDAGGAAFSYPPPTGLALSLISRLDLHAAVVVWLLISVFSLSVGVRIATGKWTLLPLVLLTVPGYLALQLGQNTPVSLLILALAAAAMKKGRPMLAGALLGLLVFKPQLALGFILWWLAAPRLRSREATAAAVTGGGLLVASAIAAPQGWLVYFRSLGELVNPPGMIPAGSFSLADFLRFLLGQGSLATVLTIVGTVALGITLVLAFRHHRSDPLLGFALAVVASTLLSPHMVSYDCLLLLVPGAILWQRLPELRPELAISAAALNTAALISAEIVLRSLPSRGWALSPAFPVLLAVATWLILRTRRTLSLSSNPSAFT